MSDAFLIRDCAEADLGAITDIYRHAVLHGTGTFEISPPGTAEMMARFKKITAGGHPYLVAQRGDEILGYAYAGPFRERPAYRLLVEDSIYVRDGRQGQGIGAALLDRLVEAATSCGFRQMSAVIGDSANLGSIRLHQNAGFLPAGVLKDVGWKFGRWLDVVLLQRALGPGASTPAADDEPLDPGEQPG